VGAVQAVLLVVLADALGDIGVFGRGDGLPRLDRLPEFVVDDAQVGNVLDDPFRFRVEA